MTNIKQLRAELEREAREIERAIREAFPAVPLPKDVPISYLDKARDEPHHYFASAYGYSEYADAFFRGVREGTVERDNSQYLWSYIKRFTPKLWTEVVGKPLFEWTAMLKNRFFMSPQGLAYYLPAYMVTCLFCQIESAVATARNSWDENSDRAVEFVGEVQGILTPPLELRGLDVWEELKKLPPKALDPKNLEMAGISEQEQFLRFLGQFTPAQKRAIQRFAQFLYRFEKGKFLEDEDEEAFVACWLRPKFE